MAVVIAPNTTTHSSRPRKPKTRSDTSLAAAAITNSSKVAQPRFWTTLQAVGSSEPRSPSGARYSTMVGTPVWEAGTAASPSRALPMAAPSTVAASACHRPSAGTSRAPATSTSRLIPRLPQSTAWSRKPSTRCWGGTGWMPHSGGRWTLAGCWLAAGITAPFAGMTRIRFEGSPTAEVGLSARYAGLPWTPPQRPAATIATALRESKAPREGIGHTGIGGTAFGADAPARRPNSADRDPRGGGHPGVVLLPGLDHSGPPTIDRHRSRVKNLRQL